MQPRNPYQGQPTSNMSFPTEAYMAAAANAARIQADAQARMGEQIGRGLQSAASSISGAMSESAAQKADYEASSKLYDSPSFRQAMGLSKEDADQQKTILKELVGDGGYKAANAYAKQQIDSLITYHAASRAFEMQKELQSSRIAQQGDVELNKIGAAAMLDARKIPFVSTPAAGQSTVRPFATPIRLDLSANQTGFY